MRAYQEYDIDYRKFLHLMAHPTGPLVPMHRSVESEQPAKMAIRSYKQTFRFVQYLKEHQEVTAVMGINDATAQHAWYALARAGYILPLECSIIGFDDTDPLLDAEGNNMLTSVHLPWSKWDAAPPISSYACSAMTSTTSTSPSSRPNSSSAVRPPRRSRGNNAGRNPPGSAVILTASAFRKAKTLISGGCFAVSPSLNPVGLPGRVFPLPQLDRQAAGVGFSTCNSSTTVSPNWR